MKLVEIGIYKIFFEYDNYLNNMAALFTATGFN